MDIRQFAVEPVATLHLRDAKDEPMYADGDPAKPMCVRLYGPGSKQYARAQARQSNRMIDKLKRKGNTEQTPEQRLEEQADFLTECTEGWENVEFGDLEGEAKSRAIYASVEIGFIADQVAKFIGDWANFSRASTKISDATSSKARG